MDTVVFDPGLGMATAMNKHLFTFGWIPLVVSFIFLWQVHESLFPTPDPDATVRPRRRWLAAAGHGLAAVLGLAGTWFYFNPVIQADQFRLDSSELRAMEVTTIQIVSRESDPYHAEVVRMTTLDDPADVRHLIGLLRDAPVGYWQGGTGHGKRGDKFYQVRFIKTDGNYIDNFLTIIPNGVTKSEIDITRLNVGLRSVGALHTPALIKWLSGSPKIL